MVCFENALVTLESACAKMATLHFVHEKKELPFIAQLTQAEQVVRSSGRDAAFALHALDENRSGRRRESVAQGNERIIRHGTEAGKDWLKAFFYLFLSGGGNARQRAAMKGIVGGENLETAFIMAELAGEFVEAFVGFGATVRKENLPRADQAGQRRPQSALRLVVIEI